MSVLLTHLSEVIRNNLAQLLSYKDMRALLDRLEPEYRRLIDEISPSQISYSGLQAVLKLLLAERISIRNLHLILEAIAEIAPHVRRAEQLAEHVRMRHRAADLRRPRRRRRAEGAAARQSLGSRLPPEPQARRQGRRRRVRHRSAPDRAVRRGSLQGDPRPHGPGPPVRAGGGARRAALCAHGHRAAVRHAAGTLATSRSRAACRSSRSAPSRDGHRLRDTVLRAARSWSSAASAAA